MSKSLPIHKASPQFVNRLLDVLSTLDECNWDQVMSLAHLRGGHAIAAKSFLQEYGLVESTDERLRLSELGKRLVQYTGNLRVDFLIYHVRLQDLEPFSYLTRILASERTMTTDQIGASLGTLATSGGKWTRKERSDVGRIYADWLQILRIADVEGNTVKYSRGRVATFDLMPTKETSTMADRSIYDFLVQHCEDPSILDKDVLDGLTSLDGIEDDNTRGERFEELVGIMFLRLGFTVRTKDGVRERRSNLNYMRPGGGDLGLFHHFPVMASGMWHPGYAIACEAKCSRFPVGSTAVSQVRNLAEKILDQFELYLVQKVVVSRSSSGYDKSGREQAPPDVVHLSTDVLIWLLGRQAELYRKDSPLLTPYTILTLLDTLKQSQTLDPHVEDIERLVGR
jgi:hypothetical protein